MISAVLPVLLLTNAGLDLHVVDVSSTTFAAILSAVVAIAASMAGTFQWKEQWIRSAFCAQQLISEQLKFMTDIEGYGGAQTAGEAIGEFVKRTEDIRMADTGQWRERAMKSSKPATWDSHSAGSETWFLWGRCSGLSTRRNPIVSPAGETVSKAIHHFSQH